MATRAWGPRRRAGGDDRATFARPEAPSEGIVHVMVNGEFVVRDERVVEGVAPGRPLRRIAGPR